MGPSSTRTPSGKALRVCNGFGVALAAAHAHAGRDVEHQCDVVGLDASEGMLAIAERHAQAARAEGQPAPTFVVGDAVAPDVPDESFDEGSHIDALLRRPEVARDLDAE